VIGRGNYGTARLVRDRQTGAKLVVKKIPLSSLSEKERRDAESECKLLATLHHPNIVEYIESFLEEESLHLVTQYCEQGDLAKLIKHYKKRGKFFPEKQIVDWFIQIAMAVDYIHSLNVMHRDLKTGNVFLTKTNVIKLGDFGIAKVLDSTLEQANTVVGTPYYMSPEVCENKQYDKKSDLWAMGCILYELCTLNHAFDASNLLGLVFKIVQESYPPIPDVYSPELRELVGQLLSKDPSRRPSCRRIFRMPFIRKRLEELATSASLGDAPASTTELKHPASAPSLIESNENHVYSSPAPVSGEEGIESSMAALNIGESNHVSTNELPPAAASSVARKTRRAHKTSSTSSSSSLPMPSSNSRQPLSGAPPPPLPPPLQKGPPLYQQQKQKQGTAEDEYLKKTMRRTTSLRRQNSDVQNRHPPRSSRVRERSEDFDSLHPRESNSSMTPSRRTMSMQTMKTPSRLEKDDAVKATSRATSPSLGGTILMPPAMLTLSSVAANLTVETQMHGLSPAELSDGSAMTPLDLAKERKLAALKKREEELRAATLSNIESRRAAKRRSQEFFMPSAENYLAGDYADTPPTASSRTEGVRYNKDHATAPGANGLALSSNSTFTQPVNQGSKEYEQYAGGEDEEASPSLTAKRLSDTREAETFAFAAPAAGVEKESKTPDLYSSSEYDNLPQQSVPTALGMRKASLPGRLTTKEALFREWDSTLATDQIHEYIHSENPHMEKSHSMHVPRSQSRSTRPATGAAGSRHSYSNSPGPSRRVATTATSARQRRTFQHVNHHHYMRPRTGSNSSGGSDVDNSRRRSLPHNRLEAYEEDQEEEIVVPYDMDERPIKASGRYDVEEWAAAQQHYQQKQRREGCRPQVSSNESEKLLQPSSASIVSVEDECSDFDSDESEELLAVHESHLVEPSPLIHDKFDEKDARLVLAECKKHVHHRGDAWAAPSSQNGKQFSRRTSQGSVMSSSGSVSTDKRIGLEWHGIAEKQRERLTNVLGTQQFDQVYAFLKKFHESNAASSSSVEIEHHLRSIVGKDKVTFCFEVDQLIYIEETYLTH